MNFCHQPWSKAEYKLNLRFLCGYSHICIINCGVKHTSLQSIASFPGLTTVQFLVTS